MLADQNEDMWDAVEALFNRRYGYRGAISDQGPTFAASPTCDVHGCAHCAAQSDMCDSAQSCTARYGTVPSGVQGGVQSGVQASAAGCCSLQLHTNAAPAVVASQIPTHNQLQF